MHLDSCSSSQLPTCSVVAVVAVLCAEQEGAELKAEAPPALPDLMRLILTLLSR